jgi:chromosome segregation ATPase
MGKLFDFNGDGKRSFGEGLLGLGLVSTVLAAAQRQDAARQAADEELRRISQVHDRLEDLEAQRSALQDQLDKWADREPENLDSAAYRRWEAAGEKLQEQIDTLDYEIEEAELELEL